MRGGRDPQDQGTRPRKDTASIVGGITDVNKHLEEASANRIPASPGVLTMKKTAGRLQGTADRLAPAFVAGHRRGVGLPWPASMLVPTRCWPPSSSTKRVDAITHSVAQIDQETGQIALMQDTNKILL